MSALRGKVAVVTGGGSGIGRATALSLAKLGAKVIITGRRVALLDAVAAEHTNIAGLVADASVPADAARTVEAATAKCGRLDILVNNAGAGAILPIADVTAEQIARIFGVNVVGPSLLVSAALPYLKDARGAIINVSSIVRA